MELPQDQPIVDRPRMHHVKGGLPRAGIVGTTQRFAIQRHQLAFVGQSGRQRLHPSGKTVLEIPRRNTGKYAPEGIMRGNAIRQGQERLKPVGFRPAKFGHRHPVIGSADRTAHRNHENINQAMRSTTLNTGVGDVGQIIQQSRRGGGHQQTLQSRGKWKDGNRSSIEREKVT